MPKNMPGSESSSAFHYVHVLRSPAKDWLYVGMTSDLRRRLVEHNGSKVFSTKPYVPLELIYYEACRDNEDAMWREKYLKTSQGARFLKRRLKQYFYKT